MKKIYQEAASLTLQKGKKGAAEEKLKAVSLRPVKVCACILNVTIHNEWTNG
jgi:hypothetical protein